MTGALRTKRLRLRPVALQDAAVLHAHRRRSGICLPGGFLPPKSPAHTRRLLKAAVRDWKAKGWSRRLYVIERRADGAWLGVISLKWPHGGVGELGYGIEPEHQGKGYASEAAKAVVERAFRLGAHRVQATCWVKNAASAKVLKRAGLRKEGVLRGFLKRGRAVRDEFMFGLARSAR